MAQPTIGPNAKALIVSGSIPDRDTHQRKETAMNIGGSTEYTIDGADMIPTIENAVNRMGSKTFRVDLEPHEFMLVIRALAGKLDGDKEEVPAVCLASKIADTYLDTEGI
jgi:hypothetical protein